MNSTANMMNSSANSLPQLTFRAIALSVVLWPASSPVTTRCSTGPVSNAVTRKVSDWYSCHSLCST